MIDPNRENDVLVRDHSGRFAPGTRWPQLLDRDWLEAELQAKPMRQIADELGCSYGPIQYRIKQFGINVPRRTRHRPGAGHPESLPRLLAAHHPNWTGERPSYSAAHQWINRNFPRIGRCEWCGRKRPRTHYAVAAPTWTRNRADWLELCVPCHRHFDRASTRTAIESRCK